MELFMLVVAELETTEMVLEFLYGVTVVLEAVGLVEKETAILVTVVTVKENLELTV